MQAVHFLSPGAGCMFSRLVLATTFTLAWPRLHVYHARLYFCQFCFFGSFASFYFGWPGGISLGLVSDMTVIERRTGKTVALIYIIVHWIDSKTRHTQLGASMN